MLDRDTNTTADLGGASSGLGSRAGWLLALLALMPILWLTLGLLLSGYPEFHVEGDMAALELATWKVAHGWDLEAGLVPLGPYSRFGFHHPGPLSFVLFSPIYELSGHRFAALLATSALINLGMMVLLIFGLSRVEGRRGLVAGSVVVAFLSLSLGPTVLSSAWNPHVSILPFVTGLVALAIMMTGRPRWLPVAVLAGSFMVQCHLGFLPSVVVLAIFAAVLSLSLTRSKLRLPPMAPGLGPSVAASAVLGTLTIAPVITAELVGKSSNLAAIGRFILESKDQPVEARSFLRAVQTVLERSGSLLLAPLGVDARSQLAGIVAMSAVALGAMLLVAVAATLWFRARGPKGKQVETSVLGRLLCWMNLVLSMLAVASVQAISGPASDYLVRWMVVVGVIAGLGLLLTWLPRQPGRWSHGAAGLAVLYLSAQGCAGVIAYGNLSDYATQEQYRIMARLEAQVLEFLDHSEVQVVRLRLLDADGTPPALGLALELSKQGRIVLSGSRLEHILSAGPALPADAELFVSGRATAAPRPDLELIASSGSWHVWSRRPDQSEEHFIDFGSPSPAAAVGAGFFPIESPTSGSFRWSKGGRSSLELPLAEGEDLILEIDVAPYGRRQQVITVELEGVAVGDIAIEPERQTYRLLIPGQRVAAWTHIDFVYAWTQSPSDAGPSGDRRQLAVRWYRLKIAPEK